MKALFLKSEGLGHDETKELAAILEGMTLEQLKVHLLWYKLLAAWLQR